MIYEGKERRRYHRIFFSREDGISATFAFSDPQKGLLTAQIINLSEGGLGLALSKNEKKRIGKGDHLILSRLTGIKGLEPLINVEVEIRWILENQSLEFVGLGCQFFDSPESMQEEIRTFIHDWYKG
jgi:c-di-GMP-binding flagellar brake protein YcgR